MKYITITALVLSGIMQQAGAQTIEEVRTLVYHQRYESAKAALNNMIARGDNSADAAYWLGEIYMKQGQPDSAAQVFRKGLDYAAANNLSKKKYPLIHIGQAHWLLDNGNQQEAQQMIESALDASKYKNVDALWAAARANIDSKNGDRNKALELLNRAIGRDKNNPALYTAMGDAYRKFINGSSAVESYMKAYAADPNYAEAMYREGMVYKTQNNDAVYTDRFAKAVAMDSLYLPAIYELYLYYFYHDLQKAGDYLSAYIRHSDATVQHDYLTADFLYLNKKYAEAIGKANTLIASEGNKVQPRLYKMIAYSKAALDDSAAATEAMQQYFARQLPEELVPQDYDLMAALVVQSSGNRADALEWYGRGLQQAKNPEERLRYMTSMAETQKDLRNFTSEADWRLKIYTEKKEPSNLDMYRWGVAVYMAKNYTMSDSIFAMYSAKYPDHVHGHLWQARSRAAIDTAMEQGLAVPHFQKLVEVAATDSVANKYVLLDAYGYLGSYEANITKDYPKALEYFEKILQMEPGNEQTVKYAELLRKWIGEGKTETEGATGQGVEE